MNKAEAWLKAVFNEKEIDFCFFLINKYKIFAT